MHAEGAPTALLFHPLPGFVPAFVGLLDDVPGDALGNFGTPARRTWTVDAIAPAVNNDVSPEKDATGVAPSTNITATFSEAMNKDSVEAQGTFTLKQGSTSVPASVRYDPLTRKATLNPNADLTTDTTYTATIATGAKDLAGNALAQERSWTFTTGIEPPPSIEAMPSALNFTVGGSSNPTCWPQEQNVTLKNNGTGSVTITPSTSSYPFFVRPTAPITIVPGATAPLTVTFEPSSSSRTTTYTGSLNLKDAGGNTVLTVPLTGVQNPCLVVGF